MPPRSLIVGFLWRFMLVYAVLIAPWPGFNATYSRYLRGLGQMVFSHQGGRRILYFEAVPKELHRVLDTRIALADRNEADGAGHVPVRYLEFDTRGVGWVPTALLISLIVATPVSWRRRSWALWWGLVTVHGFICFSLAVFIWNSSAELSLLTLTPLWKQIVGGFEETLITQIGPSFVMPVLIWILVAVRRQDIAAWQVRRERWP